MRLVSLRGDGSPHREWTCAWPSADPWSFVIPPGSAVRESDGRQWSSDYPVVALFGPGRYYQVFLLLKPQETHYYCNIIVPPAYDAAGRVVRFTDLDLDVWVGDSGPEVWDEEEFADRSARYPPSWVEEARRSRDWLVCAAKRRSGPFAPEGAARWREQLEGFPFINLRADGNRRFPTTCGPAP
ncbi:MAG: DUF402 domain-containing protein [Alicyclobacillaceae bacterium]|nr:DUF402 domain-containing protein [Alicyclobacillaceae bacterium]